jgi:hypothetical protein
MGWDIAGAFVMSAMLMVLPPDFLNGGGNGNHEEGYLFCHLGNFFVFKSINDKICSNGRQDLVPICTGD